VLLPKESGPSGKRCGAIPWGILLFVSVGFAELKKEKNVCPKMQARPQTSDTVFAYWVATISRLLKIVQ